MTTQRPVATLHRLRAAVLLAGVALALGACNHTRPAPDITGSIPDDYRQRHPIAIQEADQSIAIFVGNGRGGLNAGQRAEIVALGRTWMQEGTGAIVIDMPTQTPNARAAGDSLREIKSLLSATGIPPRGIVVRSYHPTDAQVFAAIRVSYPRITASAGPCGLWPEDLGPSVKNKSYLENTDYWNFGCASQRNLAAMVDNPSDLVQPRPETPAYNPRRTQVLDKYRQGASTATIYPDANKGKISGVGQ
ncbi:MAG: CpaD family pilus assembly protein [Xanthobacteraceae bacterium]|nr:CpaD family pilus assembly protein [Xanthobacteraceae bacterium]